jgi:glucose/arabinose dehydrogenase/mono/diheme cytochrome c family protein
MVTGFGHGPEPMFSGSCAVQQFVTKLAGAASVRNLSVSARPGTLTAMFEAFDLILNSAYTNRVRYGRLCARMASLNRNKMFLRILLILSLLAPFARAQQGDRAGEIQKPSDVSVPPSPPLSPEEALKAFKVAPGFRVELVASEPLVEDPVAMAFGPDGRIWVVEMRAYMPNVDGKGEDQPIGRIVVLEDTDGDGKMDKSNVFADGLLLPRAISLVRDGVLVAEPPHLWFMRDTDGDGKSDEKTEVAKDYGNQTSVEHTANGLVWALDNWIYSANYTFRFRSLTEDWKREGTAFRGQWGIAQDDFGRLFFNANEDQLRCDLAPSAYLFRNPNLRNPTGVNVQVIKDQSVWPIRANPGVNRGYRPGQLRPDGTLATFTAACGPTIYRGDSFPAEFRGNAFVCEPAGNLVKRDILTEKDAGITGRRAYDKSEFLASTDERFRPVSAYNGPDGGLYIVDLYRGALQHRIYVTSYLRSQIEQRHLEAPLHRGRIYRVLPESAPRRPAPKLEQASSEELVKYLSHPNGWWRDTAQRLLVERGDASVIPDLQTKALSDTNSLGRIHALWTLDGMNVMDKKTVLTSLDCEQPKVRATAIRLAEPFLKTGDKSEFLPRLAALAEKDRAGDVQLQLAFTLGQVTDPVAEQGMLTVAKNSAANVYIRDALLSGLVVRELEVLEKLLAGREWREQQPGRAELLTGLARCVFAEHKARRVERLLQLAADQPAGLAWRRLAILDAIAESTPAKAKAKQTAVKVKLLRLAGKPAGLVTLEKSDDAQVRDRVEKIRSLITWPGQPDFEPEAPVTPLTTEQKALFDAGKTFFEATCAQCHQPHGLGQEGLAPPLVDSEWVLGSEHRLTRIALQGAHGKIEVKGRAYDMDMPAFGGAFTDEELASILTYVRRSWEHSAAPVAPDTVKKVRSETAQREEAWTQAELLKIP